MTAIDFASSPLADWFDDSLFLGRLLLPLMLVVAAAHELRRSGLRPGRSSWWGLAYRLVGAGGLLCALPGQGTPYEALMQRGLNGALAVDLLTRQSWGRLAEVTGAFWKAQSDSQATFLALDADGFGPAVVRAAVAALPLIGQSSLVGMGSLARLLAVTLYVVGPVVLALSVSTGVHVLGRWVRVLVAVAVWPLLMVMVVDLAVGVIVGVERQVPSTEAALLAAGLGGFLVAASLCVPLLAWGTSTLVLRSSEAAWREITGVASLTIGRRRGTSEPRQPELKASPTRPRVEPDEDELDDELRPLTPFFSRRRLVERASSMGAEAPRATPPLPQASLGTGAFKPSAESLSPGATSLAPPSIPPVVPAEVPHGVQPRGAPSFLELPTPPAGLTAPVTPYPGPSSIAKSKGPFSPPSVPRDFADDVEAERTALVESAASAASTRKTVPVVAPKQVDRTAVQQLKE